MHASVCFMFLDWVILLLLVLLLLLLNSPFSRTTWVGWHQKGKPFWFKWSKRWWASSDISWTICRSSAPHSRQINMPAPHHSNFLQASCSSWHPTMLNNRAPSDVDKARLLAAASPHSGDWLHAPPITAVGLRLSDEAIMCGCKAFKPCVYGKAVDAHGVGLHGLSCYRSTSRQQHHSHLSDILWRASSDLRCQQLKSHWA